MNLSLLAGIAIIVLVAFLAYLPSINGGFVLDDEYLLTDSPFIRASDGPYRLWCTTESIDYWPMTNTSFWVEWRLWEMNSTGCHVTNLILHIVEALLIWVILRKMSIAGAFLAAMIFALHPVNVESVAWIAQRKNMMSMLFFLLSILWYLKIEILSPLASRSSPFCYWLSLAAFMSAMLSKGSATVLPVLLLGIIWWLRALTRRDLLRMAPFFLLAVVLTGVNIWFQTHGKDIEIRNAGFAERLLDAGCVPWFYLYKALLPIDLAFIYSQLHIAAGNPQWWLPLLAALAFTAVLWWFRKRWSRPFLFAWGFFCVSLVPVMGFTDVGFMKYSLVADHFQHIAVIGVIALAAAGWSIWHQRARNTAHRVTTAVVIVAIGTLAFLTWQQSGIYHNAIGLYQATLQKNPSCWVAYNNLGLALNNSGRMQEAIEYYEQALRLNPEYIEAHFNMGNAYAQTGGFQEAIEYYQHALRLNPNYARAHNNLGNAFVKIGRLQEAIKHYQQAIRLKPDYAEAHFNMGRTLVDAGRQQEAIEHYEQALRLKPDYADAHFNLGIALVDAGRLQEAIEHYQQAIRLKPDDADAHINLGIALAKTGRLQDAIEHYHQALRINPNFTDAYINLALTYAGTNQSSEAIAAARKGIELARSHGQGAQAKQIEDWLNSYRVNMSNSPNESPSSESKLPAH
ncbi:MAG: tetratricopeptide repeat protein [Thermoguttaceae bacterium]